MPAPKRPEIREKDVEGLKYFDKILSLFDLLHDIGTDRDRAGNRTLHMDQYCALVLLYLFNPTVSSLRAIQQASELKNVQKKLGCKRASLGSLSESVRVFDPEPIQEIIKQLGEKLGPVHHNDIFKQTKKITAVDGSLVSVMPWLSRSLLQESQDKDEVCLHTFFAVEKYVPEKIVVTGGSKRGKDAERAVMEDNVQGDHTYVMDRGYEKYALFNAIVGAGSDYVCRVRDNCRYGAIERRELTEEDIESDIITDETACIGVGRKKEDRPDHPVRIIKIRVEPRERPGYKTKPNLPSDGEMRIVTNILDLPAHVIAEIYRLRWMIEVFFRFLKHALGCRHLISTQRNGIEIQVYLAIIACMLIALYTGRKPTLRTYEMFCHYLAGWADEEELLAHIAKLKRQEA